MCVALINNSLDIFLDGTTRFEVFRSLFNVFDAILLFIIIFKEKPLKVFLFSLIGIIFIIAMAEFITMMLFVGVLDIEPEIFMGYNSYRLWVILCSRSISILVLYVVRKIKFDGLKLNLTRTVEFIVILIVNFVAMLVLLNVYKADNVYKDSRNLLIVLSGIIVFLSLGISRIIFDVMKYSNKEFEWNMREGEYLRQTDYLEQMENIMYQLRAQRHDFNHHLSCINGLVEMRDYKVLNEYTEKLIDEVNVTNTMIEFGNPVITALLNQKYNKGKRENIQMSFSVSGIEELAINPIDISIILGNALDNAIEACQKVQENRYINVKMNMKNKNIVIKVANSKAGQLIKKKNLLRTTKNDHFYHGFGLENIDHVVKKNDGIMKIQEHQDEFRLDIVMLNSSID